MSERNGFVVRFDAFCGMPGIPETFDTREEAREEIARVIVEARADGMIVETVEPGRSYEIQAPEDSRAMVGDDEGTLYLIGPETKECRWCGTEFVPENSGRSAETYCSCCCRASDTDGTCEHSDPEELQA